MGSKPICSQGGTLRRSGRFASGADEKPAGRPAVSLQAAARVAAAGLALLVRAPGCSGVPKNTGMPLEFESADRPAEANTFPNWPYPPKVLETRLGETLASGAFKTVSDKRTAYGTSGARLVEINFPDDSGEIADLRVKWKEMPRGTLDEFNDSPRRQFAAYELQKLFLDPEDYVVPTTLAFCAPLSLYPRDSIAPQRPTLPGSSCVLGLVNVWLKDVTISDDYYDEARFVSDPTYAYYLANFNLFTYLSDFADAKESNFLISKDPNRRQIFSVDNDIAFNSFLRNPFMGAWKVVFVSALRRDSIERLRKLRREDLDRLGVLAQLEKDERGIFVSVPPGENLSPNEGVRITGKTVQLGLARFEIDAIWRRMQDLIARVDAGAIALF